MRLPPMTMTLQLRLLEADDTHFYPLTVGLEISAVSATITTIWPRPKYLKNFWKSLLPRLHIDLRDKVLMLGVLGVAFGIEF